MVHRIQIRHIPQQPGTVVLERIFTEMDAILIRTRGRIKTGMCIGQHSDEVFGGDIMRKQSVYILNNGFRIQDIFRYVKMCVKLAGMNSGIGSPAAECFNRVTEKSTERFIN